MFTKKIDLSQVVNEFLSKERERNDKIQSKIVELERNSGTLNRSISSETDALVECELNDDAAGAEKCRKNIRELRTSLTETEDLITGYKKQLELSPSREKEIANIREVAVKSRKERSDAAADIQSERENLNQQMTELQRKIEQLDHEHRQMTDDHETASDRTTNDRATTFTGCRFLLAWMDAGSRS